MNFVAQNGNQAKSDGINFVSSDPQMLLITALALRKLGFFHVCCKIAFCYVFSCTSSKTNDLICHTVDTVVQKARASYFTPRVEAHILQRKGLHVEFSRVLLSVPCASRVISNTLQTFSMGTF